MLNRINENAGSLDERVSIERKIMVADGMGGFTETVSTIATLWANVSPMSGRERDMADQTESPRNYRFIVRRSAVSAAIRADDTVTWRGKAMNIRFIADAGPRPQYLMFEAEAGVAT